VGTGDRITSALEKVGSPYTIIRSAGNISGEYATFEYVSQATKPLSLEHFRKADVACNTSIVAGDVIDFAETSERFLIMNMLPDLFKGDIIVYGSIWYKCNVSSGELLRPSGETWGSDYHKETQWETIKDDCDAMQVAALYGNSLEDDQEMALLGLQKDEVYLPHSVGAQPLDRFQPASGEYYMVGTIESRRFPGVDVLIVHEDHR